MTSNPSAAYDSIDDLCWKKDIPESELISQLQAILQENPNVVHEKNEKGWTLLHWAVRWRSPEFCQVLVSLKEDLVKTADINGILPFRLACGFVNVNTAKYLYKLYPESISNRDRHGGTPLHGLLSCMQGERNGVDLVEFLLQNDRGAVSTPNILLGQLPLHIATSRNFDAISKLVFNAHPEAIHIADFRGCTPLVLLRNQNMVEMVDFFEHQIELERQAHHDRTPDNNGQLPIHRAIQSGDASVGGIKLMVEKNQASIAMTDHQGCTPLHIACHTGNLDVAKYLLGVDHNSLRKPDTKFNLPLHLACVKGNCDIILYILEQSTHGVTLQNLDNRTPIELLLFESECDRDSMAYMEAIRRLFQVNPDETLKCLMKKKDSSNTISDNGGVGNKRKRE